MSPRSEVAGLDLSLTGSGVAVLDGRSVSLHRVGSAPAGGDWEARSRRLEAVTQQVASVVVAKGTPRLAVLEGPAYTRVTGHVHDRAGLWWSVYRWMRTAGIPVLVVPPTVRAKYATGRGNAGKDEVLAAVVRRYSWAAVENNDHADALVLAAMGARLLGDPVEDSFPQAHLAALDRVSLSGIL